MFLKVSEHIIIMETQDDGFSRPVLSGSPRIEFSFKNYGRLPAIPITLSVNCENLADAPGEDKYKANFSIDPDIVIEAGQEMRRAGQTVHMILRRHERASIRKGESSLWFYGLLVYRAPTGEQYETQFCWRYDERAKSLRPHGTHNRAT
jgi:hypothetical protein